MATDAALVHTIKWCTTDCLSSTVSVKNSDLTSPEFWWNIKSQIFQLFWAHAVWCIQELKYTGTFLGSPNAGWLMTIIRWAWRHHLKWLFLSLKPMVEWKVCSVLRNVSILLITIEHFTGNPSFKRLVFKKATLSICGTMCLLSLLCFTNKEFACESTFFGAAGKWWDRT